MANTPAAEVVVPGPDGDRPVRVSSPDRIIYPATDLTAEVTKLQVAQYFAAVSGPCWPRSATARPPSSGGPAACISAGGSPWGPRTTTRTASTRSG